MEWIKCSERMPEKEKWVLVYLRKSVTIANYSSLDENWYTNEERFEKNEVTYWMPLPEKPKE